MAFRLFSSRALPRVWLRAPLAVNVNFFPRIQQRSFTTSNNQDLPSSSGQPQTHVGMKEQADLLVSQLSQEDREQMKNQLEQLIKDAGEPAPDASEGIWDRSRYREVDDLFSNLAEIDQVQSSHPQEVEEAQPFATQTEVELEPSVAVATPPTQPAQPQQPPAGSTVQTERQPSDAARRKPFAIFLIGLTSLALLKQFYDMTQHRQETTAAVPKKEAGASIAKYS